MAKRNRKLVNVDNYIKLVSIDKSLEFDRLFSRVLELCYEISPFFQITGERNDFARITTPSLDSTTKQ